MIVAALSAFLVLNRTTKTMSEAEKNAALAKMLGRKPNLTAQAVPTGNVSYKGKYASFMYPAMAKIYTYKDAGELANKTEVDSFAFDIADPRLTVYFLVNQNPTNIANLDEIPAVALREDKSQGYQQAEILIDGQKGLSFTKIDLQQSEKSGFFIVNDKIYSFSVIGSDAKEVINLFANLIETLKFIK